MMHEIGHQRKYILCKSVYIQFKIGKTYLRHYNCHSFWKEVMIKRRHSRALVYSNFLAWVVFICGNSMSCTLFALHFNDKVLKCYAKRNSQISSSNFSSSQFISAKMINQGKFIQLIDRSMFLQT